MGPNYSLHLMGSKKTNGKKWKGRQKRTGPTFKKHNIRALRDHVLLILFKRLFYYKETITTLQKENQTGY